MSLLFSEVVQYNKGRSKTGEAFHQRMADVGYGIGKRMLELASFNRDKKLTRELTHEDILKWISYTVWKRLFGKNSECNLKIYDSDEYAIVDDNLLVTRYISGADNLRCEYFVAGIVQGMLDGANFGATVTVPDLVIDGKNKPGFLIHLHKDVVERTERLTRG
ncbi:trafficking protein particle complex subunit 5 [Pelomyxa schiedti]|nr:trafficking protein particle complex subunit 5 [Pelomyxa schiedti]